MKDKAAWEAQPAKQRQERERYLEVVRKTAKGFLDLGKASLSALLHLATCDKTIGRAFTEVSSPRASRAHALLRHGWVCCPPSFATWDLLLALMRT